MIKLNLRPLAFSHLPYLPAKLARVSRISPVQLMVFNQFSLRYQGGQGYELYPLKIATISQCQL